MKKEKKTADKKAYQREYMRKWRDKGDNREKQRAASREYYQKHKSDSAFMEMMKDARKEWARKNPEKIKEYAKRAYQKSKKRTLRGCE